MNQFLVNKLLYLVGLGEIELFIDESGKVYQAIKYLDSTRTEYRLYELE